MTKHVLDEWDRIKAPDYMSKELLTVKLDAYDEAQQGFSDSIANLLTQVKNLESTAARKADVEENFSLYTQLTAFEELVDKISDMPTMAGMNQSLKKIKEQIFSLDTKASETYAPRYFVEETIDAVLKKIKKEYTTLDFFKPEIKRLDKTL